MSTWSEGKPPEPTRSPLARQIGTVFAWSALAMTLSAFGACSGGGDGQGYAADAGGDADGACTDDCIGQCVCSGKDIGQCTYECYDGPMCVDKCQPAYQYKTYAFPQCGCTDVQKCDFVKGVEACVDGFSKSANAFQPCAQASDCAIGETCFQEVCRPICQDSCTSPDADCLSHVGDLPTGYGTCTANCDPVGPDLVCGAGIGCNFVGTLGVTDCQKAGTGVGPNACSVGEPKACAPGYVCVDDGVPTCAKWCRLGQSDCTGTQVCKDFDSSHWRGGLKYGACFSQ